MTGAAAQGSLLTREEMRQWGEALGASLGPGTVVTLRGDLGAGKTTLVQAICRGYGVADDVTSPTYGLVHRYQAPRSAVHHLDLYRIETTGDLDRIGFDELVAGEDVTCIEWPELAMPRLPEDRIDLVLSHEAGDPARRRLVVSHGREAPAPGGKPAT